MVGVTRRSPCGAKGSSSSSPVFVPPSQPAEIRLLTIRNRTPVEKRFRVVPYVEMALAEAARDTRGRLVVRTDFFRRAYYFATRPTTSSRGWAFVVTTLCGRGAGARPRPFHRRRRAAT